MKEEILNEVKKEQKKMLKKFVVIVVAVGIISGTLGVAAGSYSAKQMTYTPSDNTWKVNNVSDAIDDLKFKKVSNNYSTEEQVIGTWIDGKPLYQKSFSANSPAIVGSEDTIATFNLSVDKIISLDLILQSGHEFIPAGWQYQSTSYAITNVYARATATSLAMSVGVSAYTSKPVFATIQYTKTTDSVDNN